MKAYLNDWLQHFKLQLTCNQTLLFFQRVAKITAQADKDKETSHDEGDTEEVNEKEEENEDWEEEDKNRLEVLVKNNNQYKCVSTDKLKFLDIANFIAPVFSYTQYLAAFDVEEQKDFFVTTSLSQARTNLMYLIFHPGSFLRFTGK